MEDSKTIDSVINAADPMLLSLSVSIKSKIESYLDHIKITLPKSDISTLSRNISDVLLGTLPIKDAAGKIIDEIVEYALVAPMLEGLFHEVFLDTLPKLKQYPINGDPASILFLDKLYTEVESNGQYEKNKGDTMRILTELGNNIDDTKPNDRMNILNAIENPTPTIATPTFILPNTKPSTSDVLKNLTKPSESIPATIPTAFPPELDLSLDTAGIIDPFKTAAPTSQPGISAQMDAKLSDMTGSATKESFKIVPLSETMKSLAESQGTKKADPYREPIE